MTGKDWFILGTRLIAIVVMYYGIQEWLAYIVRDMLFANLERSFTQPYASWASLFHGAVNVGMAWIVLAKAEKLADWCYGKDETKFGRRTSDRDVETPTDADLPASSREGPDDLAEKDYN
jgi:hypothetical protein